jgi:hypothetical protein
MENGGTQMPSCDLNLLLTLSFAELPTLKTLLSGAKMREAFLGKIARESNPQGRLSSLLSLVLLEQVTSLSR